MVHLNYAVFSHRDDKIKTLYRLETAGKRSPAKLVLGCVLGLIAAGGIAAGWMLMQAGKTPSVPTIAFIPQTTGAMLWEVEHQGAIQAAERLKYRLYWNAPTSESDVAGQALLIDRVTRGKYQGLVVAPNHLLAVLAPLRRAVAAGLPVVIVSAPLELPSEGKLAYIVNDDSKMGELAAVEALRLIGGKGSIALLGISRFSPGITARVRGAERILAEHSLQVKIVSRLPGAYNASFSEVQAGTAADSHPELGAILSFSAPSTRGALAALRTRSRQRSVSLIGCEQDFDLLDAVTQGDIAAIVAEDTYRMGYEAVGLVSASIGGKALPSRSVVPPLVITKAKHRFSGSSSVYERRK